MRRRPVPRPSSPSMSRLPIRAPSWRRLLVVLSLAGAPAAILDAQSASAARPADAAGPALADGEDRATLGGVVHWYRVAGAAHRTTPVVVVHGGPGGNTYNFERTAGAALERFATVVYYDQRGSGRSAAPADSTAYSIPILVADLEALRRHLGAARIAPLGFSFGGELAAEYALAHPDRVERLVLEAPSTGSWERMAAVQLFGFPAAADGAMAARLWAIARDTGTAEARVDRMWGAADTRTVDRLLFVDSAAARRNRAMWDASGLRNTGQMYRALRRRPAAAPGLVERAAAIAAPTLLVVGLHDRNVGVDAVRDLADRIPRARLAILERSAHFPDAEETGRFVEEVRAFLAERTARAP